MIQRRSYRYELRSGSATIATGHLSGAEALEVGDRIEIAGFAGIIRSVEPMLGEHELRLVVDLASTIARQVEIARQLSPSTEHE